MDEKKEIPAAQVTPSSGRDVQDLKAAREARGLSLMDIFHATRVSMINLTAVENGDFHHLPPPVYTRNFIRKYARAVGIDEKPLLDRYERHLESLNPPREEPEVQKPWPEAGRRYRFLFGSLAAVIAAGVLVYALFLYDQSDKTIPPAQPIASPTAKEGNIALIAPADPAAPAPATAPVPVAPAVPAAAPVPAPPSAPAPVTAKESVPVAELAAVRPPSAPSGKMLHLVIETRDLSWIRITEDQNPSYQVLLKPGDRIERLASDYFQLDIGNAGGVNLIYQGKSLGSLGKQGEVIHLRLPEKTEKKKSPGRSSCLTTTQG
ncbi:MAG: helix-turn-helix domain-containing protein [Syntrophales bacterium]